MALLPGRKLGSRILRFGHKGPDVQQLHAFLRLQGYDLGTEEDFGYLTKDALKRWQRDHGLVADGIAGKRFFALALKKNLPIRRRIHVVEAKETIEQIARGYQVGTKAFVGPSYQGEVYPGQRLVFFDREIWGICPDDSKFESPVALTGFVCQNYFNKFSEKPSMLRPAVKESRDLLKIHQRLQNYSNRKKTVQEFLNLFNEGKFCGLYLPWMAVAPLDGRRYLKVLKMFRRRLKPPAQLWVELGNGVPDLKLWGGIDYAAVNELADRVVLGLPPPKLPGPLFTPSEGEKLVESLLPSIHSWKILFKTPLYALEWSLEGENMEQIKLPYQTALSRAMRRGARLSYDEEGFPYYGYKKQNSEYQIRLPHHHLISEVAAIANRHNLAGLILDELGMEDRRIWGKLTECFCIATLNISD